MPLFIVGLTVTICNNKGKGDTAIEVQDIFVGEDGDDAMKKAVLSTQALLDTQREHSEGIDDLSLLVESGWCRELSASPDEATLYADMVSGRSIMPNASLLSRALLQRSGEAMSFLVHVGLSLKAFVKYDDDAENGVHLPMMTLQGCYLVVDATTEQNAKSAALMWLCNGRSTSTLERDSVRVGPEKENAWFHAISSYPLTQDQKELFFSLSKQGAVRSRAINGKHVMV